MTGEVEELRLGIRAAHKLQLRFLIWAGAGGAAEDKAMYHAAGLLNRGPRTYILDSTDPGKLNHILEDAERRSRLSLPSILKSTLVAGLDDGAGSSEPLINLERVACLYATHKIGSTSNFVCMAAAGSALDSFARERGYRTVEPRLGSTNCAPLTRGSLYSLALARVHLDEWIAGALLSPEQINTAFRLASFLHAQAEAGRDKITVLLPRQWTGAALWTKQNFEGTAGMRAMPGLKVFIPGRVKLANYRSPRDPCQDRAFVAVQIKGAPSADAQKIAMLRRAGYPVATVTMSRGARLSSYMQFAHYAASGLAQLRGVATAAETGAATVVATTACIVADAARSGGVAKTRAWRALMEAEPAVTWRGALTLHVGGASGIDASESEAPQIYASLLMRLASERKIEYGELAFFGDTRYSPQGAALLRILQRAAEEVFRARLKMGADVCEGPAMTETGCGRGLSTMLFSRRQEQLPAGGYASEYHTAQFLAAHRLLCDSGRPVVAITLEDLGDESLAIVGEFFHRAALALKAAKFRS